MLAIGQVKEQGLIYSDFRRNSILGCVGFIHPTNILSVPHGQSDVMDDGPIVVYCDLWKLEKSGIYSQGQRVSFFGRPIYGMEAGRLSRGSSLNFACTDDDSNFLLLPNLFADKVSAISL